MICYTEAITSAVFMNIKLNVAEVIIEHYWYCVL